MDALSKLLREFQDENRKSMATAVAEMKNDVNASVSKQLQSFRQGLPAQTSAPPDPPSQTAARDATVVVRAEIPLEAPVYQSGTGGVRAFERCEIWQELGSHSIYAYHAKKSKEVGKFPELGNKEQFYEWNLALFEMLEMFHLKSLVTNLLRDPSFYVSAVPVQANPLEFHLKRRAGVSEENNVIILSSIQLAKIYELNFNMTTALKGAALHLVQERRAENFMDKLFILEHNWGASNPRIKKGFWHEFTTTKYNPQKKTPYEFYHRMHWLLRNCPEIAPAGSVQDQLMRDKLMDSMPPTWAHILNTIHEDPNKDPAHIAQRLENFYQNARTAGRNSEYAQIMFTGTLAPPTKRPKVDQPTPPPQPAKAPQPSPKVLKTTEVTPPPVKKDRPEPYKVQTVYGICWNCGDPGHYINECPKPPQKGKGKGVGKGGSKGKGKGKGGKGGKKGKGKGGKTSEGKRKS